MCHNHCHLHVSEHHQQDVSKSVQSSAEGGSAVVCNGAGCAAPGRALQQAVGGAAVAPLQDMQEPVTDIKDCGRLLMAPTGSYQSQPLADGRQQAELDATQHVADVAQHSLLMAAQVS
jgi:hypothetical protein